MKIVETLTGFDDRYAGVYRATKGERFECDDNRASQLVKQELVKVIDHGVAGKSKKGAPEDKSLSGAPENKGGLADVGGGSLDRMKKDDLAELAGGYGIDVPEDATKAEIIALIDEAKG